jgi:phosphatidylglycerophosphate synthase
MEAFFWILEPVADGCQHVGITANMVTAASFGLSASAGIALALGHPGVGALLAAVSASGDALDGAVARRAATSSVAGGVLDSAADRYDEFALLAGLTFALRDSPALLGLALLAMLASFMVSYSTAKAEALQLPAPRGAMRRLERAVCVIVGTALAPVAEVVHPGSSRVPIALALALIGILGNASAIQRFAAVARAARARQWPDRSGDRAASAGWARTRSLVRGLQPFCLLALVYYAMRFFPRPAPGNVHLCDLRAIDARLFGAHERTVHDWFQSHPSLALDLACAVPYGTFLAVAVLFAIYLFSKDEAAMRRFGWTVLVVDVWGFVTYRMYPAAPPWYFHAHGCVVDLATRASEGPSLARVDAFLGAPVFHAFYARSSEVFGAVPSLHVTYPLLVLLSGWPLLRGLGRALAAAYFAAMCFAAVYLDHHWMLDVVLGVAYALAGHAVVGFVMRAERQEPPAPEEAGVSVS